MLPVFFEISKPEHLLKLIESFSDGDEGAEAFIRDYKSYHSESD